MAAAFICGVLVGGTLGGFAVAVIAAGARIEVRQEQDPLAPLRGETEYDFWRRAVPPYEGRR